jgi:hypothetical protein
MGTHAPSYLLPEVPAGLEGLAELALDMRWSWSHSADEIWQRIHPELWEQTRNPWVILQATAPAQLQALARDAAFVVREDADGKVTVSFMDPQAVLQLVDNPGVGALATEVRARLDRVRDALVTAT